MIDIIETALNLHNNVTLTKIPYHYLTRKETLPLISLDRLSMKIQMNQYVQPYVHQSMEDILKLDYQVPCKDHVKDLLENFDIIYVSMAHLSNDIKEHNKEFYYSEMYKQFHFTFQLLDWNEEFLNVQIIPLNQNDFINHQYIARKFEINFNLKHNLKKYITCPCCFPTLVGISLFYKEMNGKVPTKLAMIDERYKNALVLIKNDRINLENVFKVAQTKWKCHTYENYEKRLVTLGEKHKWDFQNIVIDLHKTHYSILKNCERLRDQSNAQWKGRNTNSPSWRSVKDPL